MGRNTGITTYQKIYDIKLYKYSKSLRKRISCQVDSGTRMVVIRGSCLMFGLVGSYWRRLVFVQGIRCFSSFVEKLLVQIQVLVCFNNIHITNLMLLLLLLLFLESI